MKLALIGLGQAGGKIVDRFVAYDRRTVGDFVRGAVAVNTARTDLEGLDHVHDRRRVLIGEDRVGGRGVGADAELGASITEADIDAIHAAIDDLPVHDLDGFLVVAGLGGGTGAGGAPVLGKHLELVYSEPVYGLGVLPGVDEGGIYTLNAARSYRTFVREVDNLLLFDNDAWRRTGESVAGAYDRLNGALVRRFGTLFVAGEVANGSVGETVVDAAEITTTLRDGVSSIGFATETVETDGGLWSRLGSADGPDEPAATTRLTTLIRKATHGQVTLPCNVASAERALVVAFGPPAHLSRKGIERGRAWLEDEIGTLEVRGGDYPIPGADEVGAVVLLSGITDVPRIEQLQRAAVRAQE